MIREWSYIPWSDIYSLIEYLQHYVISRPTLAPYVRAKILQVIAILIKIVSSHDFGEQRKKMLDMVETLIRKGDLPKRILGCNILSAILQEYATNAKSSDIGRTWEWHFKEKMEFERTDMQRIFKFCVEMFVELTEKLMEEETLSLVKHLLAIAESMLVWGYFYLDAYLNFIALPKRLVSLCVASESADNPPLTLSSVWRDVILDPIVLNVFFMVYLKIRNNLQIAHHAMNCLVQLASLHGTVMFSEHDKLKYLTNYMERFLTLVRSIDINNQEASGITNIIRKINCYFRSSFNFLPKALYISYVQEVTRLTCLFINSTVQEESIYSDDPLYMEAVERMLGTLLTNFYPTAELCEVSSSQIFQSYIQYRLSPMRENAESYDKREDKKEIAEVEEDDRIKFDNQLQTIGVFGRQTATYSLSLLTELLEKRIQKLCDNLNVLVGQKNSLSRPDSMDDLYEELHWLILIMGHVLCVESEGEPILIPLEITRCSMNQSRDGQVDVNRTLEFLVSSQNVQLDLNRPICSIDPVIRLIADVFRLCAIEKTLISLKLENILSPELSSTITWFLRRISQSYLLPRERYYAEISTTILQIFGDDTPGASWTMDFLLDKVIYNINAFKSEPTIVQETIKLLISLVESETKASYLLKSEQFKYIIELAMKGQYNCPQVVKRGLMHAVVQIGVMLQDMSTINKSDTSDTSISNVKQTFWSQTLESLQHRCTQLISSDNFMSSYHQEEIKVQIIDILESFIGITEGVKGPVTELVFQHTYPILAALPKLLSLYHNYQEIVQLILELFCEYTKAILFYLSEANSERVYEVCLETIQTYARCNSNRLTVDSTAEEDSYHDILLLMQLLTNLLSKDIFNLNPDEQNQCHQSPFKAKSTIGTPADVFFYGLSIIMPLMTMDLLKFPSLCLQYFKMISFACDICPEKVCSLPTKLLQQLLASVELGLYSFGYKAAVLCCDAIQVLAKHIYTETAKGQQCSDMMLPFLNSLINLILSGQMDLDLMSSVSMPLYYLMCCYNEQYTELVKNIIHSQTDNQVATRLTDSFLLLTASVEFNAERVQRMKFKDNFDKFVTLVRGFLMIK
ncbi:Exportin-4 [Ooceraea biroi]|uniref:Exportin-4 n=1 Tax=Ooceraea biroi TaxID=2015173 RepID=A0A026WPC1_OOCBI|nr:Exportin-4 [Ooceraea biroi]